MLRVTGLLDNCENRHTPAVYMKNESHDRIELPPELAKAVADTYDTLASFEGLVEIFLRQTTAKMNELRVSKSGLKKKMCAAIGVSEADFENYHIEREGEKVFLRFCEGCAEIPSPEPQPFMVGIDPASGMPDALKQMAQNMMKKLQAQGIPIGQVQVSLAAMPPPTAPTADDDEPSDGTQQSHSA